LRISDAQTTKEYKDYKGHLTTFAKEMSIRYFVQGDVRKFGDQIKISARLLDIETGDYIWQQSHKGKFEDIFEIQEVVAEKVVAGLNLTITKKELSLLEERGTENAEAYELFLKANEYYEYTSKEGFRHSIQLLSEAIKLDPNYARAYTHKASSLTTLYRNYDRNPQYLIEAEALVTEALRIKPDLWSAYTPLGNIYLLQGKLKEAESVHNEFVQKAPEDFRSHFSLGLFYHHTNQYSKAIPPYEESIRLNSDRLINLSNLAIACNMANEGEKCAYWALVAIPKFERHLKLHPDDEAQRVNYALLLFYSGQIKEAGVAAHELQNVKDGFSLYNTASLFVSLGEPVEALKTFRKALQIGYKDIHYIRDFSDDINNNILFERVKGTPEHEDIKAMVEKIVVEQLGEAGAP
ncbi:MAG: tetratricopeptide repeat protein, partial [Candidatus Kapaibacterium sp.]